MTKQGHAFNPMAFLSTVGDGRSMMSLRKGQAIYAQGDAANALFVIQKGKVKLGVRSQAGREVISTY